MKRGGVEAFRDVPEQPYLEESRQLLRRTVGNYERISPTPAAAAQKSDAAKQPPERRQ
jgi:hypothetical protein